jgi:formate dehydrogenase iron-sulfur subunit
MAEKTLEIMRASGSTASAPGIRQEAALSKLIDTTTCIGCKACEVACQQWNDLEPELTVQFGSYQTLPELQPRFWNLIRFNETEVNGSLAWLMRKDQCMHCADPGCLVACPAPNAVVQYANGIVDFNQDACIGCGYCIAGCPFNIPKLNQKTSRVDRRAARGTVESQRIPQRRHLRPAGSGRHGRGHGAGARRSARALPAAERSLGAGRGDAVEASHPLAGRHRDGRGGGDREPALSAVRA